MSGCLRRGEEAAVKRLDDVDAHVQVVALTALQSGWSADERLALRKTGRELAVAHRAALGSADVARVNPLLSDGGEAPCSGDGIQPAPSAMPVSKKVLMKLPGDSRNQLAGPLGADALWQQPHAVASI